MAKVVYLTGAPASGKSTTIQQLKGEIPRLQVWGYSEQLAEHLKRRLPELRGPDELRERSSTIVRSEDIEAVDRALVGFVAEHRATQNIIVDSHAVTKENYGFRITAFSLELFSQLAPDEIWVFYASPSTIVERINADPGGRPSITEEDARFHTSLQASVAATYGMSIGGAVHLFNTDVDRGELVDRLKGRLL